MDVHAVLGEAGAGATATALNLAVALRGDGHHAAVMDLTGDVSALLAGDLADAEPLADGGSVAAATVDVPLRADGLEGALREYHERVAADERAFREGESGGARPAGRGDGAGHDLPVIVGGGADALADATPERRESLRADLAFAYDQVIVDAGTPEVGAYAFADGHLVVTTPDEDGVDAARRAVVACLGADGLVVGAVINRATADTSVSTIRDRMRTDVVGVIPGDARTPELEPVAYTAPEAPAAAAYGRLADAVADWSGESGLVDGGPEPELATDGDDSADADAEDAGGSTRHPFDADPGTDSDTDDEDDGGLLSRFF